MRSPDERIQEQVLGGREGGREGGGGRFSGWGLGSGVLGLGSRFWGLGFGVRRFTGPGSVCTGEAMTAAERKGNTLKDRKDFWLKASTRFGP